MTGGKGSVLLLYPRYRYWLASSLEEPLGILYIATALTRAGFDVHVIDLTFEKTLKRVGAALEGRVIAVGMSVTSPLLDRAVEVMNFMRARRPSVPMIMGGPHPSAFPENALESGFDYAVVGEGEQAVVSLVQGILSNDVSRVKGLAYKDASGEVRTSPADFVADLDSLPFPERSHLDYTKYEKMGLITSRGCPYKCLYCKPMQETLFGKRIRRRTPENVVREIASTRAQCGPRIIHFRDDTFTLASVEWFTDFRDLAREFFPRGITFQCNSRVDQLDEEKARLMKEAGCVQIFFGVESGSQRILDFYQKGTTPQQAIHAFKLCKRYKMQAVAAIMLGAPIETTEDLKMTYDLVKRIKPDNWIVYTTTAFPGNYLYEYAKEHNLIRVSRSQEYDNALNKRAGILPLALEHLSARDIRKYSRKIDRYMIRTTIMRWHTLRNVVRRPRSAYYKVMNVLGVGSGRRSGRTDQKGSSSIC